MKSIALAAVLSALVALTAASHVPEARAADKFAAKPQRAQQPRPPRAAPPPRAHHPKPAKPPKAAQGDTFAPPPKKPK